MGSALARPAARPRQLSTNPYTEVFIMRIAALLAASALHAGTADMTIIELPTARIEATGVTVTVTPVDGKWLIPIQPR
jgi:hypothetical protein